MRLSEFWQRMDEQFGSAYAHSIARDYVLAELGDRTVEQALADGEEAKAVWRAVCAAFNIPARLRLTRRRLPPLTGTGGRLPAAP